MSDVGLAASDVGLAMSRVGGAASDVGLAMSRVGLAASDVGLATSHDQDRKLACLAVDLELLRRRGAACGLANFLEALEAEVVPLFGSEV